MATFQDVLDHFGGTHEELAKALDCSRALVTTWDGVIPELWAYKIQVLSHGKFKFEDLPTRPRNEPRAA